MNLTKLFNLKYFLQNIKKSKMAIVLFTTLVPLFTSLYLIMSADGAYYTPEYMEFTSLSVINIIFMYVVPFILSVSLFGYVYKKTSVDFMGSMPISRKSIFLTNTLGGIILIILTQLITLICTFILKYIIADSIVIFSGLILDVFIYQTIAYIFVFSVCNLAMSLSGNLITQIALTLLITFLIPFTNSVFTEFETQKRANLISNGETIATMYNYDSTIYTAPAMIFTGDYEYNTYSMIKMGVLTILYIGLGTYIFNKRKMEVAGTSFENKWIHLGVKTLTLAPFCALLVALVDSSDYEVILMLLAIMLVYYFIYDLITNKKIKIPLSIGAFCISVIALFGIYKAGIEICEDLPIKNIDVDKTEYIEIVSIANERFLENINLVIKDEKIINKIYYTISGKGTYGSATSVAIESSESKAVNFPIGIKMHFKNNNEYNISTYLNIEEVEEILAMLDDNKISDISNFEICLYNSNTDLTKEQKEKIKQSLNSALVKYTPLKYFELENNSQLLVKASQYKNHKLYERYIPLAIDKEVEKLIVAIYNQETYRYINTNRNAYFYISDYDRKVISTYFSDYEEMYQILDRGFEGYDENFKKFVEENYNKEVDFEKPYFVIRGGNRSKFYTNNVEEVINLLKSNAEDYEDIKYKEVYYD